MYAGSDGKDSDTMFQRLSVVKESPTGRNLVFRDNRTGLIEIGRAYVEKILNGGYSQYHLRMINGELTIVSNPDKSLSNNLG